MKTVSAWYGSVGVALVVIAVAPACGGGGTTPGGGASSSSVTGAGSSSSTTSSGTGTGGATTGGAGGGGGADGGATMPSGTPIEWADRWVDGFYGTVAYQGIDVYSNTNTAGSPDGYYTQWRGDPGVSLFGNESDCSSFSDTLMNRSYGWIPATNNPRPLAEDYYWAIRNGQGFTEITQVSDIAVGDVIALLYPPGAQDTGHVAWIDALPQAFSGSPDETGLSQWVVTVIDSTNGFHDGVSGPSTQADDRYLGAPTNGGPCTDTQCRTLYGPNALCNTTSLISYDVCSYMGVGRGQMRFYVDATGTIQGHTWDPNPLSTFYARPSPLPAQGGTFTGEDIVVGRYSGG
jgi:hypothetical protein